MILELLCVVEEWSAFIWFGCMSLWLPIVVSVSELNPFANSSVPPLEFQNIEHLLSVPACRYMQVQLELNGQRCLSNVKQDTYINSLVFPWQQKDWINIFCTLVPTRSVHIMNWCPAHRLFNMLPSKANRFHGPVDGQQPTLLSIAWVMYLWITNRLTSRSFLSLLLRTPFFYQ